MMRSKKEMIREQRKTVYEKDVRKEAKAERQKESERKNTNKM